LHQFDSAGASASPIALTSNDNVLKCIFCKESFLSELLLESHILSIHPAEKISCNACNFNCPNYSILKLHRSMFHLAKHPGNNNGPIRPLDFSSPPSGVEIIKLFMVVIYKRP
jgi:NAD-dependent dihydropyrimidine dehydrogenase PreA subunit